jgi:hypothetical protein
MARHMFDAKTFSHRALSMNDPSTDTLADALAKTVERGRWR